MEKATLTKAVRVKMRTYKVRLYVGNVFVGEYEVDAYDKDNASEMAWELAEMEYSSEVEEIKNGRTTY